MKKHLLLAFTLFAAMAGISQIRPEMVFIEGGTRNLGGGYQFMIKDYYMVLLGGDPAYSKLNDGQVVIGEVPGPNNPSRQVTVSGFYMSKTEVTNLQYREFLIDSLLKPAEAAAFRAKLKAGGKHSTDNARLQWQPVFDNAAAAGLLPDTACWTRDFQFAYNDPLARNYLWHSAFDSYPVVGVSWKQAHAYCSWLTTAVNREILRKNPDALLQPMYRLPTEMEWQWAALPNLIPGAEPDTYRNDIYPWPGRYLTDEKGRYRANIKTQPGDYIGDNYEYTCPVKAFPPNDRGLYGMAGNVSEWCDDNFIFNSQEKNSELDPLRRPGGILLVEDGEQGPATEMRVVKGGSWAEYCYGAMCGSRMPFHQAQGSSRIGFRVAQIKLGSPR